MKTPSLAKSVNYLFTVSFLNYSFKGRECCLVSNVGTLEFLLLSNFPQKMLFIFH